MTVHFIGAGPGAADLLTVRAVNLIKESPVCVYAGTYVGAEVLAHCPPGATLIDSQHLDLDAIIAALVGAHRAGQDVARLCSGDPSLYSALAEQTRRLDRAGVPWDVTPGSTRVRRRRGAARPGVDRPRARADGDLDPHVRGIDEDAGFGVAGPAGRVAGHAGAAPGHPAHPADLCRTRPRLRTRRCRSPWSPGRPSRRS